MSASLILGGIKSRVGILIAVAVFGCSCHQAAERQVSAESEECSDTSASHYEEQFSIEGKVVETRSMTWSPEVCRDSGAAYYKERFSTGDQALEQGDSSSAWSCFMEARSCAESLDDYSALAAAYVRLAGTTRFLAFQNLYHDSALTYYRRCGDLRGEAAMLLKLGPLDARSSDEGYVGLQQLERALDLSEELGDTALQVEAMIALADTYREGHNVPFDRDVAIAHYSRARAFFDKVGDRSRAASMHRYIVGLSGRAMEFDAVVEEFRDILEVYRDLDEKENELETLAGLASICWTNKRLDSAIQYTDSCLMLARQMGDTSSIAQHLQLKAWISLEAGDKEPVEGLLAEADDLRTGIRPWPYWEHMMAMQLTGRDMPELALRYGFDALQEFEELSDSAMIPLVLITLGSTYSALGRSDSALAYFDRCIGRAREHDDTRNVLLAFWAIGEHYRRDDKIDSVMMYMDSALNLSRLDTSIHAAWDQYSTLWHTADIWYKHGQPDSAISAHMKVLDLARLLNDSTGEMSGLQAMGELFRELGEKENALGCYRQCWGLAWKSGDHNVSRRVSNIIAELEGEIAADSASAGE